MRIAVLLNPSSGRAATRRVTRAIQKVFSRSEIHWFNSAIAAGYHLRQNGGTADITLMLAVGGDGTLHHLVNGVVGIRAPLGIIPCGRANDFARGLGIPLDPLEACEALRSPYLVEVDLVSINGRFMLTCGGLGLVTAASERADRWRRGPLQVMARALGPLCYPAAALREIIGKEDVITISTDDAKTFHDVSSLVVSNQARFGGRFSVSPGASHSDGKVDICELPATVAFRERARICLTAWQGRNMESLPGVRNHLARRFKVRTKNPCTFTGDGEPMDYGREFVIKVHPRRLVVAVPQSARPKWAA